MGNLMPFRVRRVLLIASPYDFFILEEDGRLLETLNRSYYERCLGYVPEIVHVLNIPDAEIRLTESTFDLIIATAIGGDELIPFCRKVKETWPDTETAILAYRTPELQRIAESIQQGSSIAHLFSWEGNGDIIAAIIQLIEDKRNTPGDVVAAFLPVILLVEDAPEFYSLMLPALFAEINQGIAASMTGDLAYSRRQWLHQSRPRILMARTLKEARRLFVRFRENLVAVISDFTFPGSGRESTGTGARFLTEIGRKCPRLPLLLNSSEAEAEAKALSLKVRFLLKSSPLFLSDLRRFIRETLAFGPMMLKEETGRETVLQHPVQLLRILPDIRSESALEFMMKLITWLQSHAWLDLAAKVKRQVASISESDRETVVTGVMNEVAAFIRQQQFGTIVPYSRRFHEEGIGFSRLGDGSIGGKARGLMFLNRILAKADLIRDFPDIEISIPPTLVLATGIFDDFLIRNNLRDEEVIETPDRNKIGKFLKGSLSPVHLGDLRSYIEQIRSPLAVRSSSLLEDSLFQPFAGIYLTKMLPNDQLDDDVRFQNFVNAVKLVYSSVFFAQAKSYIQNTGHAIEEEKMAVVVQEVVGTRHGDRFYPDFSGVARSYDFYPAGHAQPQDGIAHVSIGLGKMVVDGGQALAFCPAYPGVLPQYGTIKDMFQFSQREIYAVSMQRRSTNAFELEDQYLLRLPLDQIEADDTLTPFVSVYNRENDCLYDGTSASGAKIVTFAGILKHEQFPLAEILKRLLRICSEFMGSPVEIEFAVNLQQRPPKFSVLQVRPLVVGDTWNETQWPEGETVSAWGLSHRALGNGSFSDIRDILLVDPERFNAAKTTEIAREVENFNRRLASDNRRYILIGPGRWGSTDPWLGIPVKFPQISSASVIVEAAIPGMNVDPSQGSHFFQNITSLRIGYLSIGMDTPREFIDWEWLSRLSAVEESAFVRWIHSDRPFPVVIDGRNSRAMLQKPVG